MAVSLHRPTLSLPSQGNLTQRESVAKAKPARLDQRGFQDDAPVQHLDGLEQRGMQAGG